MLEGSLCKLGTSEVQETIHHFFTHEESEAGRSYGLKDAKVTSKDTSGDCPLLVVHYF